MLLGRSLGTIGRGGEREGVGMLLFPVLAAENRISGARKWFPLSLKKTYFKNLVFSSE